MLLVALSVVVLTRTQFGRDALRSQVVRTFNNSFEGSLEIGRLQGNLVQDLFASDVRLFDPEGREVLRVDSVAMRPHWRSLFGGAFIADEVTLVRPRVSLMLDEDGEWNLLRALASSDPGGGPSNPLDFHAATLRLVAGEVTTTNEGALPSSVRSGILFDYTNASLSGLDAELELDWRDNVKLFRVASFQGNLGANALVVEALEGLITVADGNVQVDNFDLVTSRSQLHGTITLTRVSGGPDNVDARLRATRIAAADLTAILPSLPLTDAVALQGHIHGPLSTLTVDDLVLSRGGTEILVEGTLSGLPDSLAFNLTTPGSRIRSEDLLAVVPSLVLPAEATRLGLVRVEGDVSGAVQLGRLRSGVRLVADVEVATDAGSVDGYAELRSAPGTPLRFTLDVEASGVNPAVFTANEELEGHVSGRIFVERTGADGNITVFRIGLGPSSFAGRSADSLLADGIWRGRTVEAIVAIRQGSSRLEGELFVDGDESALSFDGTLSAFNLNQLLPEAPATRFTGPVSAALAGTSLADLQTEIEADFSEAVLEVDGEMQELPTGPFSLLVAPPGQPGSRFRLTTEVIEADLKGDLDLESAIALGNRWGSAFAYTVAVEINKPLRSPVKSIAPPSGRTGRFRSPERFQLDVRVLDPDALQAFLPNVPLFASGTRIILGGVIGSDSLGVDLTAAGSRFKAGGFEAGRYDVYMEAHGRFAPNLSETLSINLEADAANLHLGPRGIRQSHVTAQLRLEAKHDAAPRTPGAARRPQPSRHQRSRRCDRRNLVEWRRPHRRRPVHRRRRA